MPHQGFYFNSRSSIKNQHISNLVNLQSQCRFTFTFIMLMQLIAIFTLSVFYWHSRGSMEAKVTLGLVLNVVLLGIAILSYMRWERRNALPQKAYNIIPFLMPIILILNYELIWKEKTKDITEQQIASVLGTLYILMMTPIFLLRTKLQKFLLYVPMTLCYIQIAIRESFQFQEFFLFLYLPLPFLKVLLLDNLKFDHSTTKTAEKIDSNIVVDMALKTITQDSDDAFLLINKNMDPLVMNPAFQQYLNIDEPTSKEIRGKFKDISQISCVDTIQQIVNEVSDLDPKSSGIVTKPASELALKTGVNPDSIINFDRRPEKNASLTSLKNFGLENTNNGYQNLYVTLEQIFAKSKTLKENGFAWNTTNKAPQFYKTSCNYKSNTIELQLAFLEYKESDYILVRLGTAQELQKQRGQLSVLELASIVHDLKTPLYAMGRLLNLATEKYVQEDELIEEYIQPALNCNSTLFNLIKDIQDYSQMLAGKFKLKLETFDIEEVLKTPIQLLQAIAKSKQTATLSPTLKKSSQEKDNDDVSKSQEDYVDIQLHISDQVPISVCSDSGRLCQIIYNLVGNSLKFTNKGCISINISLNPEDNNYIDFSIKDTGKGMKPDQVEKLFKVFTSFDDTQHQNPDGVGLGLCISNAIAQKLGHRQLSVESVYEEGSEFKFQIFRHPQSLESPLHIHHRQKQYSLQNNSQTMKKSLFCDEVGGGGVGGTIPRIQSSPKAEIINIEDSNDYFTPSEELRNRMYRQTGNRRESNEICLDVTHSKHPTQMYQFNPSNPTSNHEINSEDVSPRDAETIHKNIEDSVKIVDSSSSKKFYPKRGGGGSGGGKQKNVSRTDSGAPLMENGEEDPENLTKQSLPDANGEQTQCQCPQFIVVDDDGFILQSINVQTQKLNIKCKRFSNVTECITYLKENKRSCNNCQGPYFMLMDINLGEQDGFKDGFEVSEELGNLMDSELIDDIPMLAFSSDDSEEFEAKLDGSRMQSSVKKSINGRGLQNLIQKYKNMKRKIQNLNI